MIDLTNQDKFLLGAAQQYAQDPHRTTEHTTPDNKSHEGIDSAGRIMPAPWLQRQQ